jgi:SAM-dependent methyltransferase
MSHPSTAEVATKFLPQPNELPQPDDSRYFPPAFKEHLESQYYGGGIDLDSYRNYMRAEIQRGREIARMLCPWTEIEGKRVLDIGCGFCGLLIVMKEAGAKSIAGVELDTNRIHWAKLRTESLGYEADLRELDICSESAVEQLGEYDIILAQDVIEHVSDPSAAIKHISQLLRPGGVVFIHVGNKFSPGQLMGDHHYHLPGITMLSRPQAIEYFHTRLGQPKENYAVGHWREEKYYRNVFRRNGVTLHRVNHYPTPDLIVLSAAVISELCTRLEKNLWPDLRPELAKRMRRRMLKIAELYVHASRQLPLLESQPSLLEQACDEIVGRLLVEVWRLVGVKEAKSPEGSEENQKGRRTG